MIVANWYHEVRDLKNSGLHEKVYCSDGFLRCLATVKSVTVKWIRENYELPVLIVRMLFL